MKQLYFRAYPDVLTKPARTIEAYDETLRNEVHRLMSTMEHVGIWCLAAPQVGLNKALFLIPSSHLLAKSTCFINPTVVEKQGEFPFASECLYFPGMKALVNRPQRIHIRYTDEFGSPQEIVAENELAAIIDYQMDCLQGKLVTDHMSKLKKDSFLKKYKKVMNEDACGHGCGHDHH